MSEVFIKFRKHYAQQLVKVCFKDRKKNGKLLSGVQLLKRQRVKLSVVVSVPLFINVKTSASPKLNSVCNSALSSWSWTCMEGS